MNPTRRLLFLLALPPLTLLISAAQNEPPTPTPDAATPAPAESFIPLEGVVAVAAGENDTCALDEKGGVWCWGSGWAGQLGDETVTSSRSATPLPMLTSGVQSIVAGADFNCVLTRAGGVKCWGYNGSGQLGDGTTEERGTPQDVVGLTSGVGQIAAGRWHACAVTTAGQVLCWGDNNYGKVNGREEEYDQEFSTPVSVVGLEGEFQAVAAGYRHTCALSTQGSVTCWGGPGLLGRDDFGSVPSVIAQLEQQVVELAAGLSHTCVVLANGEVRCWGDNEAGQLGNGAFEESRLPAQVAGLPGAASHVTAGWRQTCAIVSRQLYCWGGNEFGQLGDGTTETRASPLPVVDLAPGVNSASAGYYHTCAVSEREAFCWGSHLSGQLGEGALAHSSTPVKVAGLQGRAIAVDAGESHTCAILEGGELQCWGSDLEGQLGDDRLGIRGLPVGAIGLSEGVAAVSLGGEFTCALTEAGDLECWGRNTWGELGDGTNDQRSIPGEGVTGLSSGVQVVAAGQYHACALTQASAVQCWGWNDNGRLGEGGKVEESLVPVSVSGLAGGVSEISAGYGHTCALLDSGAVECWGDVPRTGAEVDSAPRLEPVEVGGLPSGIDALYSGEHHTCALTQQGELYCWGRSGAQSTELHRITPEGGAVVSAAGGNYFTCVLDESGQVSCLGDNDNGELGDGTAEARENLAPVRTLPDDVLALAAGEHHVCALTDAGEIYCWGDNHFGQLGDGSMPYTRPVQVVRVGQAPSRAFREPSTFVPALTTYIPTPLDVSTDPKVVGTNLALAALAMLPFAAAAELLTRTLGERRLSLPGRYDPAARFAAVRRRLGSLLERLLRRERLREAGRVILILLFYGLVFSLLDRSWKPFTLGGLVLLLYMTIAYGVVGLADDIAQWRAARRWQIPASFKLRPANVLLAVASTATTRLLNLVPGLMFGTPEALEVEETRLDGPNRARLTRVSAFALVGVALVLWIPSALTTWLQDRGVSGGLATALGALEAFLVLTFAVALENIFVKMLGLPGSMGEALRQRNRWLWLGTLVASGFAFYHTLLNPQGELATALEEGNVRLFLGAVAAFVLVSFSMWLYFRWRDQGLSLRFRMPAFPMRSKLRSTEPDPAPGPGATGPPLTVVPTTAPEASPGLQPAEQMVPATMPPVTEAAAPATVPGIQLPAMETAAPALKPSPDDGHVLKADEKRCPLCAETIKLEARICRYCRTGFEVTVQGYCARDHAIVTMDQRDRCTRCGGEVIDRQVKSRWLGERSGPPRVGSGGAPTKERPSAGQIPYAAVLASAASSTAPRRRRPLPRAGKVALPAAGLAVAAISAVFVLQRLQPARQAAEVPGPSDLMRQAQGQPTRHEPPTQVPARVPSATLRPSQTPDAVGTAKAHAMLEQAEALGRPVLTAIEGRSPHAHQDFETRQEWGMLQPGISVENGRLIFAVSAQDSWFPPIAEYQDFLYQFEFTPRAATREARLDVFLRQQDNSFYAIGISPATGTWIVEVHHDPEIRDPLLASGQTEPSVFDEPNLLQIVAFGARMAFFLNGSPVAYVEDDTISGTWHPIVVHAEQGSALIEIDDIKIWNLRMLPIEW